MEICFRMWINEMLQLEKTRTNQVENHNEIGFFSTEKAKKGCFVAATPRNEKSHLRNYDILSTVLS